MKLRAWLIKEGRLAREIALATDKSPQLVSKWLNGQRKPLAADIAKIEAFTRGKVKLRDWLDDPAAPPGAPEAGAQA